jgi:hypothetical protein
MEKELNLLSEFMNVYVQLLFYCKELGGQRLSKYQLPTFEYFKETYYNESYSLAIPSFKESYILINNEYVPVYANGLGVADGDKFRYYNYWMGCKYFIGNNVNGDYTFVKTTL